MSKRTVMQLMLLIITILFLFSACAGNSAAATAAANPSASALDSSSASATAPSVDPETVIKNYLDAQNKQDWATVLSCLTRQEQVFYKDFFADAANDENHNGYFAIKSVAQAAVKEIENIPALMENDEFFNLPYTVQADFDYTLCDQYGELHLYIVKTNYALHKPVMDYREGLNDRAIALVNEDNAWKIAQDYQSYPDAAEDFGDPVPDEDENTDGEDENDTPLQDGKVYFEKTFEGYFLGSNSADPVRIGVKTLDGENKWFYLNDDGFDPETVERYTKIKFKWTNEDKLLESAGEVVNMDIASGIAANE